MNPLVITQLAKNVNVKKIIMYAGGALAIVLLYLYVRKKIDESQAAKKLREYNKSLQAAIEEDSLSYLDADYKIMADQIYTYLTEAGIMNGGFMGVNQKGIYAVMEKMYTKADIYKLIDAFGQRELRAPYKLLGKKLHTLPTAFSEILFKDERKKIAKILSEKGLEFPFVG